MKTLSFINKLAIAFVLTINGAGMARADLIPPEVEACEGHKQGDACEEGKKTCQQATCTRPDYSRWTDRDQAPPTMQYDCMKCLAAVANDAGTSDGGDEEKKDSGCSVGGLGESARPVGPWLMAGAFSALFFLRRRR